MSNMESFVLNLCSNYNKEIQNRSNSKLLLDIENTNLPKQVSSILVKRSDAIWVSVEEEDDYDGESTVLGGLSMINDWKQYVTK